jgi:hypothetical protein
MSDSNNDKREGQGSFHFTFEMLKDNYIFTFTLNKEKNKNDLNSIRNNKVYETHLTCRTRWISFYVNYLGGVRKISSARQMHTLPSH